MKFNQTKSYQRVHAISASKIGQVAILLDHCVRLLDKSIHAIQENKIEERYHTIDQAIVIIGTITNNLDQESSVYAKKLITFFTTMVAGLHKVNIENDAELCGKIQTCILEMAKIWYNADKSPESQSDSPLPTTAAATPPPLNPEAFQLSI